MFLRIEQCWTFVGLQETWWKEISTGQLGGKDWLDEKEGTFKAVILTEWQNTDGWLPDKKNNRYCLKPDGYF